MKTLWYNFFKVFLKVSLFFYTKKIRVSGKKNIPRKGAVLFAVNHPNGLIDPLLVTTNIPRVNHFLVKADVFKKPAIKWFLSTLNLMPIYRIRDGASNLGKNKQIFEDCYSIFKRQETLMIFPEGSHNHRRTVRTISKGFTRIVFGAIEKYPDVKITIVPVGITYLNASNYPSKVAINFGKPILANSFLENNELQMATAKLKNEVSLQLKVLSVHIPNNEYYKTTLEKLNNAQVDFTEVKKVNAIINSEEILSKKPAIKNNYKWLFGLIIINNLFPYFIWKTIAKKINELEFVDTFKFAINALTIPIFLGLQTWLVSFLLGNKTAFLYALISVFLILCYTKLAPTNTPNNNSE